MSQEFSCTPSVAIEEYEADPELIGAILTLRSFVAAYEAVEVARKHDTDPDLTVAIKRYLEIEAAVVKSRIQPQPVPVTG